MSLGIALPAPAEPLKNVALKESAAKVRDDQVKTLKILDGALERLRTTYKPNQTELATAYEDWKEIYNGFAGHIDEADRRISELNQIADDLFAEWAQEAELISDSNLKNRSLDKLEDTKEHFQEIKEQLVEKRASTQEIIVKLRDRMLFIKHSLNAQSLEMLREEASDIEDDLEDLRDDMEKELVKLNEFIGTLP
jgi:predicted  nucleic acid-binding Zn-ribbon protein